MSNISTVGARDKLKARREPYWHKLGVGTSLGFRRLGGSQPGTWVVRSRGDDGKQKYHALGTFESLAPTMRYEAASKAAHAWLEHLAKGGSHEELTVGDACRAYVQKLRDDGREATAKDADSRFKRWIYGDTALTKLPLAKLTPQVLEKWRTKVAGTKVIPQNKAKEAVKKRSAATLNRDMAGFKAALNLAHENGYATSSAAWDTKLKPVEAAGGRRDVYLDREQRQKLIEHAAPDVALFIRALSALPLRPGAIAARTVADFEPRLSTLRIGTDKNGTARTIPLPPETAALFAQQCKDKLPAAPLFARGDGSAWNKDAWKGPIKDAVLAAGLPPAATAYSLRHSTVTDLIAVHELDLLTVSKLADTSLQMIEKHYGHLRRAHAASALAKLAI